MKSLLKNFKISFLLFLIIVNLSIFYSLYQVGNNKMSVAFLDVGQGDAVFIKIPGGRKLLIDGGPNNSVLRELGKVMPFYDRSIDVVLATHADQDHIGGLVEVLKRFNVDLFIRSNTVSSSAVYNELENLIKEKNIREIVITSPQLLTLGPGAELDILFPSQDTAGWEVNDASIVSKLIYGDNSFLLTGDSPQLIEKYLVGKYGSFLDSDVLKAGHHGSRTSSSELFVGTVSPEYSVISAGLDNQFNHPHQEVLDIFSQFQNKILSTLGGGLIQFETNGKDLTLIK